ncbi:DUF6415 family natural product biosynthesis protein [Streptomyces sp. NPDC004528]|uniref:DUF6415 family natural product biosynthesis protein n=1 Tax=Streptomyces sp. NPDC004528 TaxID=3154550 RepID=UPI00339E3446
MTVITKWQPPLTAEQLGAVVEKVRAWKPLSLTDIFDDLDRILGAQQPAAGELGEMGERLRGALMQLSSIAVADPGHRPDAETLALVERGRALRDEEMTGGYRTDLGLARRMAWTTSDLVERMINERHIKDDD